MGKKLDKQKNNIINLDRLGPGNKKEEPIASIVPKLLEFVTPIISNKSAGLTEASCG